MPANLHILGLIPFRHPNYVLPAIAPSEQKLCSLLDACTNPPKKFYVIAKKNVIFFQKNTNFL